MYPPTPRFTLAEYLALDEASEYKWEYEDGRVYCLAGSTNDHATIVANLCAALIQAIGNRPCWILTESPKVIVSASRYYYPDLVVSCDAREEGADTAVRYPLVIAEVLSPSTEQHDRGTKLFAYQQLASVETILLIATDEPSVLMFERVQGEVGQWISRTYQAALPEMQIASLRLAIHLADLYRRTSLAFERT